MPDKAEFIILPKDTMDVDLSNDPTTLEKKVYLRGSKSRYVSDGYHTFDELYLYRLLYNAALFNQWGQTYDEKTEARMYDVHKSWKHSDGQPAFGGGWFVVVAQLPTGQITNHYKAEYWDLFNIPARDTAAEWDGHTPQDVAARLTEFLKGGTSEVKA